MREGTASRTAQFVALNRALGDLAPIVPGFSDALAHRMLAERWQARVRRAEAHLPRSPFPLWLRGMGIFNQYRTVVFDRAVRDALPFGQLVILGAGLDTRAWRLPELSNTAVFEVDHPDTQAWKRSRVEGLVSKAAEVRYVPMDFNRDALATRLGQAGFQRSRTTLWLWEGVTMYLSRPRMWSGRSRKSPTFPRAGGRSPRRTCRR